GGVAGSLSSIKTWLQVVGIAWLLTILMLLAGMIGVMIRGRRWATETSERIDPLYHWKPSIEKELKTIETKLEQPPAVVLSLSTETSRALQGLFNVLTEIAETRLPPKSGGDSESESKPPQKDAPEIRATPVAPAVFESGHQDPVQNAKNWYQR